MNRKELSEYIAGVYGTDGDSPWRDPDTVVYRHPENGKWFALVMADIPLEKFGQSGFSGEGEVADVVNLKCDPIAIGSVISENRGVYPAYHMNKQHWISVLLDFSRVRGADNEVLKMLLDVSFDLAFSLPRKKTEK